MGKVLKDWAQAERDQFDSELSGGNCSCHIAPPCGSCTHPGNPLNQAEDEDCWEWETITEILDEMEMDARTAIAKAVDASASRHIAEMRATQAVKQGGARPKGIPMNFPNVEVKPHWLATLERAAEEMPYCRWACSALCNGAEPEIEEEVRTAISKAIAPFTLVNSWLVRETGTYFATREEAQEYRSAWLNHMIEQCRAMQETE